MSIHASCPACAKSINVPENAAGKRVRCPACNAVFTLALPETEADAVEATAKPEADTAVPEVKEARESGIRASTPRLAPKAVTEPERRRKPQRQRENETQRSGTGLKIVLAGGILFAGFLVLLCAGAGAGAWLHLRSAPGRDPDNANANMAQANDEKMKPPAKGEPALKVAPPAPRTIQITAPDLGEDKVTRPFPDRFDQLALGGGGRFLLLSLPAQRKIALFDVNEAKIVHYFPVSGDGVRFAAGLDKLVMVFPDSKIIQRWSLLTKEREVTATIDANGTIKNVLMGSASRGPIVIGAGERFEGEVVILDLADLKPRSVGKVNRAGRGFSEYARISADGNVVACWGSGSPSGFQIYHVSSAGLKSVYEHISPGHLVPAPDGKTIYTGRGMFTNEGVGLGVNAKSRDGSGRWCNPAVHGNYYLSVNINNFGPAGKQPRVLSVHLADEERALITLPNIPLPKNLNPWGREPFGNDQRILFIPDAKLIITIPETNDSLILHRFDIGEALDKAGIDYLYATSRAPSHIGAGEEYVYPIVTRSKKGGVSYKLESAPQGMSITKAGVLHWKVPADHAAGEIAVIVTIADASGQEVFHTFRITIEDAPGKKK